MLNVLFFAQVRELTGTDRLALDTDDYADVEALRLALCARGDRWALALERGKLLAAVNQSLVEMNHPLRAGDEVAFFPPVTGG
ncbi:molybdopterin synthase sulfur carrier subunit [Affinibrenneria salicis]|uniref:Molybdopterin synthase sulfur carrier subunit n=1 Tax=Affinibrenneria salicis TaxID=2590031 RepID=A0A5J5G221_9GAMM|nr:molybdopterin synthase sulfur carrier subunit [Affinibrenneria salicis]KAA9000590.1 molybdopterin synthase sulfur carrier subunit [Affinibrenneria salicis]